MFLFRTPTHIPAASPGQDTGAPHGTDPVGSSYTAPGEHAAGTTVPGRKESVVIVGDPGEWVPLARRRLASERLDVLAVVENAPDALTLVPNLQPDIVLVDAEHASAIGPFDLARRLSAMAIGGRTVLAGPRDGLHWRYQAQAAGAAYLLKSTLDASRLLATA